MIIITENNYKPLNQIVKTNSPSIIFYPNIFDKKTNTTLTDILKSLQFDKNSQICFNDFSVCLPVFLQ